jgi:threonine dehydrogenase-like Zn-dependent dehydrogenase
VRAAVFQQPFVIEVVDRPDPRIENSTDAVVRVTTTCVCGSDLWYFRGLSPREHGQTIGHEFLGVVEAVGSGVSELKEGDFVIAPFMWRDGDCVHCRFGVPTSCTRGGLWGAPGADGGQGEYVRVPFADATLVVVPAGAATSAVIPSLLALSDVMGTGHHAAVLSGVRAGSVVAVVGDGAVGLCGVIAAHRLGASRVIALSRHPSRSALAVGFGATDIVPERGPDAATAIRDLTAGVGVDAVLECVGTSESMSTAFDIVRPGGGIGFVGVPHGVELPVSKIFSSNIRVAGGLAPAREYLPDLLEDVLSGTISPGDVFDTEASLESIAAGYRAMDDRTATKVIVRLD